MKRNKKFRENYTITEEDFCDPVGDTKNQI